MHEAAHTLELRPCPACGHKNVDDSRFCAGCGHAFEQPAESREIDRGLGGDPLVGREIADRYRIVSLLGRGGMGAVYKVEHIRIGKLMAMKLLHGELARDKDSLRRFKREAELVSKLHHPNTVQIFDFGRSEGLTYLVMEFLPGRDFGWILQRDGVVPFTRAARICAQVCGSLSEAHERGLVHRDLKPENVMILESKDDPNRIKVLDFGLAMLRESALEGRITRKGTLLGTPYYMAPEHIRGETMDARADLYAMGAILYKAVVGAPPFTAPTSIGVLTKHLTEPVAAPSSRAPHREIPPECDRIVLKAMQKDPRDRYQDAEELRDDLLRYLASVGEDSGISAERLKAPPGATEPPRASQVTTKTAVADEMAVATRGDIDRYERGIRRMHWLGRILLLLCIGGVAGGGAYAWSVRKPPQQSTEIEPNNTLQTATPLRENEPLEAYIGRRTSLSASDADIYKIDNHRGDGALFALDVTALPNIDLVVEIVKAGVETPMLLANTGGVGEPERVPNFVFEGATYYVRVREVWKEDRFATENISDTYSIVWRSVAKDPTDEEEVNDAPSLANPIDVGAERTGFIGWAGDTDVYCLAANARDVTATLDPPAGLDLALTVHDKIDETDTRLDAAGADGNETSEPLAHGMQGRTCFVVAASTERGAPGANAEAKYVLRLLGTHE